MVEYVQISSIMQHLKLQNVDNIPLIIILVICKKLNRCEDGQNILSVMGSIHWPQD
jgi:hypothetical protein